MQLNPGVDLQEHDGQLLLVFTRRFDEPTEADTKYDERLKLARAHAGVISDDHLLRGTPLWLVDQLVERFAAKPVTYHLDDIRVERIPILGGNRTEKSEPQITLRFSVIARGAASAAHMNLNSGRAGALLFDEARVREIDLASAMNPGALKSSLDGFGDRLRDAVERANNEIEQRRSEMHAELLETLSTRHQGARALHDAAATLGIPIGPRRTPERIPVQPQRLNLKRVEAAADRGEPLWKLDEAVAEDITTLIMGFSLALERLPDSANQLLRADEETIRDVLLFLINANYQGAATGETFRRKGKTDILLRWRDRDAFIAECKFWAGSQKFTDAIDQLLGYTVWRDTRIALILFLRDVADTTAAIMKAADCITNHPRFIAAVLTPDDPLRRRDYLMHVTDDMDHPVRVSLLPVVITKPR